MSRLLKKGLRFCAGALMIGLLVGCEEKKAALPVSYDLPQYQVYGDGDFEFDYGCYFNENGILKFTDKKSGKTVVVSNEPDKVEKTSENPAYIGDASFVFMNGETLYCVSRDMSNNEIRIEKSGANRSDIKKISSHAGMQVCNYVRIKDSIYFFISSPVAKENPETGIPEYTGEGKSELMRLDLKTDQVEFTGVVLSGMNGEAIIFGGEGNNLYYFMYEIVNNEYVVTLQKKDMNDLQSQSVEIKKLIGNRIGFTFMKEDTIYYQMYEEDNSISLFSYDMSSGETKQLESSEELAAWFRNYGRE